MLLNVTIPQVGDQVRLTTQVFNGGNIKASRLIAAWSMEQNSIEEATSIQVRVVNQHGIGHPTIRSCNA